MEDAQADPERHDAPPPHPARDQGDPSADAAPAPSDPGDEPSDPPLPRTPDPRPPPHIVPGVWPTTTEALRDRHGHSYEATGPDPDSEIPRPDRFINRELSWLEFNQRVLEEALDPEVPTLERLKFLGIVVSNLDEFFMVRVAGLIEQSVERVLRVKEDGLTPDEQLDRIGPRAGRMLDDAYAVLASEILPTIAARGVRLRKPEELTPAARRHLEAYFVDQVLPVLTPLAIDPGHPFPHVRNGSLNLVAMLTGSVRRPAHSVAFAVIQVPSVLPRLVRIPDGVGEDEPSPDDPEPPSEGAARPVDFVLLDDVIGMHVAELFSGFRCLGAWSFRVLRNSDLEVDEEEAEDLLETIAEEIRRRDRGRAVRLTVDADMDPAAIEMLSAALGVDRRFVYPLDGPLSLPDLSALGKPLADEKDLRDEPFEPQVLPPFRGSQDPFAVIREGDLLLYHPYESFDPVVQWIETAADDPDVLAIKQTLYRTSGDSPIVKALSRAAENGKQVTALVELKARFDEEKNIQWAKTLEEAGVHVVYGLLGLKTHCKTALVVRREGDGLRRYVHLGTGNYHPQTARLYTDLSYFTCRPEFGVDATALFNLLTSCTAPGNWRKITVAPLGLFERILGLIEREAAYARAGKPARILAKMNSLVDPDAIQALYKASQAGVQIDLIVRGICCLRPGIPGLSDNIRVRSIVDRFLEHARIYCFEADGRQEVYCSSADWMPRNFHRRVEALFPIEDPALKTRLLDEILAIQLEDNVKARLQRADGTYERIRPEEGAPVVRSQAAFLRLAREAADRADALERRERPFVVRPVRKNRTAFETSTGTTPAVPTRETNPPPPPAAPPEPAGE
jgi:polyphosphate kinase